jgi:hypothetical protein
MLNTMRTIMQYQYFPTEIFLLWVAPNR